MLIPVSDLPAFTEFLRKRCHAQQLTTFTPSPNENGEYFRAIAAGHFVLASVDGDQVRITSHEKYLPVIEARWASLQPAVPVATGSRFSQWLRALLPGTAR
jgi:hypothetical protein